MKIITTVLLMFNFSCRDVTNNDIIVDIHPHDLSNDRYFCRKKGFVNSAFLAPRGFYKIGDTLKIKPAK